MSDTRPMSAETHCTTKRRRVDCGDRNNDSKVPSSQTQQTQVVDNFRRRDYFVTINNPEDQVYEVLDSWMTDPKVVEISAQEERGHEEGTLHIQGYIKFKNAMKRANLFKVMGRGFDAEAPRNEFASKNYCQKNDTACGKRWMKGGKEEEEEIEDWFEVDKATDWQKRIIEVVQTKPHRRRIYWFWDKEGQTGKSTLARHLVLKYGAIPVCGKSSDVKFAIACMKKKPKIVIWDVPRKLENKLYYEGMEEVKNGMFFSPKYEAKPCTYNPPHVIVFANFYPQKERLSEDRWHIEYVGKTPLGSSVLDMDLGADAPFLFASHD